MMQRASLLAGRPAPSRPAGAGSPTSRIRRERANL